MEEAVSSAADPERQGTGVHVKVMFCFYDTYGRGGRLRRTRFLNRFVRQCVNRSARWIGIRLEIYEDPFHRPVRPMTDHPELSGNAGANGTRDPQAICPAEHTFGQGDAPGNGPALRFPRGVMGKHHGDRDHDVSCSAWPVFNGVPDRRHCLLHASRHRIFLRISAGAIPQDAIGVAFRLTAFKRYRYRPLQSDTAIRISGYQEYTSRSAPCQAPSS